MPQMAPMLWLVLFMYFVILFVFYIVNFYFVVLPVSPSSSRLTETQSVKFNWLW